jgi:hypothetical protein
VSTLLNAVGCIPAYAVGMGEGADDQKDKNDNPKHSVEDEKATGKQPGDIDPTQYSPRDDK